MIDKMQTGKNIKRLLCEKDIGITNLARIFGSGSTVYYWITGKSLPSVENLFKLARVFDCSVYDIVAVKHDCSKNIDYCRQGIDEMSELYDLSKIAESKEDVKKWLNAKYEE